MTRYTPQWIQAGTYPASLDRRLMGALWPSAAVSGMAVTAAAAMQVNVAPGQAAIPTSNGSGSVLCTSDAVESINLPAAPGSGTNRIDLVIIRPRGTDLDGGANNDFIVDYVSSPVVAAPVAPAAPAGTVGLAQVYVAGGSASITQPNITDVRPGPLNVGGSTPNSYPRGFITLGIGPSVQTDATTNSAVVTLSVPVIAGRRYRVWAFSNTTQITASGSPRTWITPTGGPVTPDLPGTLMVTYSTSMAASNTLVGMAGHTFTATANGVATFTLNLGSTAGGLRANVNSCQMHAEDIGST
jgi:hypothetical protein